MSWLKKHSFSGLFASILDWDGTPFPALAGGIAFLFFFYQNTFEKVPWRKTFAEIRTLWNNDFFLPQTSRPRRCVRIWRRNVITSAIWIPVWCWRPKDRNTGGFRETGDFEISLQCHAERKCHFPWSGDPEVRTRREAGFRQSTAVQHGGFR